MQYGKLKLDSSWCIFVSNIILIGSSIILKSQAANRVFPQYTKFGDVGIFVLLIFENKQDREINHFNMTSKHLGECQFVLKLLYWFLDLEELRGFSWNQKNMTT